MGNLVIEQNPFLIETHKYSSSPNPTSAATMRACRCAAFTSPTKISNSPSSPAEPSQIAIA